VDPIEVIDGRVSVLDRSDVDTDQIMPKQFLKRIERTGFGQFVFYDWAKEPGWHLEANPILATGPNFGCGSSRQHAAWGLLDFGFKVIVAPSFADIFYTNCTTIGLLPVALEQEQVRTLMDAGYGRVDLTNQTVSAGGESFSFDIDPEVRHRLLNGLDDIDITLESADDIAAYERTKERAGPVTTSL
jgi:3-isopropylmalate/(R)-2-methylmalate dehydratase small subunit